MNVLNGAAPDVVCLAPLRIEAMAVASGLRSSPAGRRARVVRTGAGATRAAATARAVLDGMAPTPGGSERSGRSAGSEGAGAGNPGRSGGTAVAGPVATVVTGVAGGLRAGLAAGHLVVADVLIGVNGDAIDVDLSPAAGLAHALRAAGLSVRVAPVATSVRLVRGADARTAVAAATGALAVDLESAILASVAWPGPFAVVRAVVDRPESELLSPATITGGIAALRSLRRAAPVIAAWAATLHPNPLSTTPGRR